MKTKKSMPIINPELTLDYLIANSTGKGVEVAVLDSGVDASHPDLKGKVKQAYVVKEDSYGKINIEEIAAEKSYDDLGHGTAVAGIITDLAPDAKIIVIKVLDARNTCSSDVLIEGIRLALNQKIKLINMSVSTSDRKDIPSLFKLCEQAYVQNSLIITSKLNVPFRRIPGPLGNYGCPAMFSSVISVDLCKTEDKYFIRYNRERLIEYGARGENIKAPWPGGEYYKITGTSFATPHVTGIVALLVQLMPGILPYEVKSIINSMAHK